MTQNDLKQIAKVVDERINSVNERIDGIKNDVSGLKTDVHNLKTEVHSVKTDVHNLKTEVHSVKTDVHNLKTEMGDLRNTIETRVLPPLTYIETTLKANADQYVANEDHIGRLDKRLTTVEDKLDINPPEDLMIPQVG